MPITPLGPTPQEAGKALTILKPWLSHSQYATLQQLCDPATEEHEHFWQLVTTYADRIKNMPATYQTDGQADPIAYLHYFTGGCDWYITEKDIDPDGEGQIQAFGAANLEGGAELGYINLVEILQAGGELDLYWSPKPLSQVKS